MVPAMLDTIVRSVPVYTVYMHYMHYMSTGYASCIIACAYTCACVRVGMGAGSPTKFLVDKQKRIAYIYS